jgi:enamine deaminase RidA (YjgF/YER057c/UK114 family)
MQREKLNPPGVATPRGQYSHVVRVRDTLYIAGQTAVDQEGTLVGKGDAEAQAEQCLRNIEAILEHFGGTLDNLVKTTTYITQWAFRPQLAAARERILPKPYPASTLVVVSGLASPDYLIEIEAIAVLDE